MAATELPAEIPSAARDLVLNTGTKLGQYEIREMIGQGGMGEVYRATDTKLKRDVAIKLLPEQFASDPERLARFRREAQLLASLNHPNIATIHGLEDANGSHFLVMELVPGETLAETIHQSPDRERGADPSRAREQAGAAGLPIDDALRITSQICEALEAAHEKGIIHRDLKPANIKLTPDGKVKVLDFGLAKAFAADSSSADRSLDSNSPTVAPLPRSPGASPTMPGVILGTAAYMSPEQAKGKTVDRRTDIWALGCVLYELLTGQAAFRGEDVTEILASVVKSEPDWLLLPAATPLSVRVLLRRCLQKDRTQRLRDAGDIRIQIAESLAAPTSIGSPGAAAPTSAWRRVLPFVLTGLGTAVIATMAVWIMKPTPVAPPRPVSRFVMQLPSEEHRIAPGFTGPALALSPDGSRLAYVAIHSGVQQLYLRDMDSLDSKPISGTEQADAPFFSPDGQWIAFFVGGKLKKVPVGGGAVQTLCDAFGGDGGTWASDGTIYFGSGPPAGVGISKIPAAGGTPQVVTSPDAKKGEYTYQWPEVVPGGKALLFAIQPAVAADPATWQIVAESLESGERHVLVRGGTYPRYLPSGHLLYYHDGTLMAVPFDRERLEVNGTPAPVLEGVATTPGFRGAAQFTVSQGGSLAYVTGGRLGTEQTLIWVDRKGVAQPIPATPRTYQNPRLSPDGRQVALNIVDSGKSDIWIYDLARDTLTRLTFEGSDAYPLWTPDGKRIVYRSQRGGPPNLFWKPADGSGQEERLTTSEHQNTANSFSPDGRILVYSDLDPKTNSYDIWALPFEGERKPPFDTLSTAPIAGQAVLSKAGGPRPVLQTPFDERTARLSPDGHWLAYVSDESGRYEIYVQPFPGPGGKYQISTEGGSEPFWGQNGELFYRSGANREKMMAVDTQTQSRFSAGKPRLLFEGPYVSNEASGSWTANYSVTPDGQRFLMLKAGGASAPMTQINVVLNWFEELKAKVPVK